MCRFHINLLYRIRQKYLMILPNSCEWNRWSGEFVIERPSSETQSISVAMERWSVEHRAFAVETYLKTTILSWLRGYFVGTSIFIGTSVPSRNTSSSKDISRARCTKRNQGQRRIWNRTSGKKWQQFLPTCCKSDAELPETPGGMRWQQGTPPHRHCIQEVNFVIKRLWVKENFINKFA